MKKIVFLLMVFLSSSLVQAGIKIEHWQAPSGASVYFVENHDLPILDVKVDFAAGSAYETAEKSGTAALLLNIIDMGAADMDETQIANRLADLGAHLSGGVDKDRASLSLRTLSAADKREPALAVLRAVLVSPQFPAEVFAREKARSVAALKEALTRPDSIASRAFWASLYPSHPYGYQTTPETLNALQREDLLQFYRQHFSARRAAVTIVGDISKAQAESLAQDLTADLPAGGDIPPLAVPGLPDGGEKRIAHPAAQAHLLIGLPTLKRGDPDFYPLLVGNYSLGGGGFVSRLMKEVREKRGFAYSVYSFFAPLAQPGPFQIGLQTKKAQAGEALKLTRDVLARFIAEGPDEDEILAAKQNLTGSFPLRLDSNRKILDNVAAIAFYGMPLDYLDRYTENIDKVSAADIKAAFARHIRQPHLVTVVVGGE